ncbi:MAG: glycosyltransferase [Candidatus Auribacterota bacterium]|jgi:cellulose synthase/poly-beta-1,6-N-acetylglucosamine synthase-like glycosyltransferase|nr:glycosyltransferase [Candidatus Auribacterota bacterium]
MINDKNQSDDSRPYLPFVSVVVPAYNSAAMMELCLAALLAQTYPKNMYEIIIVDNKSTDSTADIIKKYPVIYLLEADRQSPYAARNKGIMHAKGEIVAFTDSDCVADEHWIEKAVERFRDPAVIGVGGRIRGYKPRRYIEIYQEKRRMFNQQATLSPERIAKKTAAIATNNAFYRKYILEKVGYFDCTIFGGGDFDLTYRIQAQTDGKLVYADDSVIYHKHASSIRKLWEQYSRYGYGNIQSEFDKQQLLAIYKDMRKYGYLKVVFWRLYRFGILKNIPLIGINFILFIFGKDKPTYRVRLIDAFLSCVEQSAFLSGELKSLSRNKKELFKLYVSQKNTG